MRKLEDCSKARKEVHEIGNRVLKTWCEVNQVDYTQESLKVGDIVDPKGKMYSMEYTMKRTEYVLLNYTD